MFLAGSGGPYNTDFWCLRWVFLIVRFRMMKDILLFECRDVFSEFRGISRKYSLGQPQLFFRTNIRPSSGFEIYHQYSVVESQCIVI